MAVEFISYGYDTAPGEGIGELVWQEMFPQIGSGTYAVRSTTDWKVTAVSGADRTVSIAAGRGLGMGIIDKTTANDTIQLDPIVSGSRWDLIVCRRDPTPTKGVSQFMKINGGASPVIPGARLSGPGIHDQPLALVQVTAGQTQPTGFIDLRTWVGDGGGLVANSDLVRSFLLTPGTVLNINGLEWVRRVGANDILEWFCPDEPTEYAPVALPSWQVTGSIHTKPAGSKKHVTTVITCKRTSGDFNLDSTAFVPVGTVIPTGAQGGDEQPLYDVRGLINGGNNTPVHVSLNPISGLLSIRAVTTDHLVKTGSQFSVNFTYYI